MAKRTRGIATALAALVIAGFGACDQPPTGDPDPAFSDPILSTVVEPQARPVSPPSGGSPTYESMCRHYCGTLETTLVVACIASGGENAACQELHAATTDRCFEVRCLTGRVTASVCLAQCDAMTAHHDRACAVITPATESLCASFYPDGDRRCREGCGGL